MRAEVSRGIPRFGRDARPSNRASTIATLSCYVFRSDCRRCGKYQRFCSDFGGAFNRAAAFEIGIVRYAIRRLIFCEDGWIE